MTQTPRVPGARAQAPVDLLSWAELSLEQRVCAAVLGMTEATWDEDDSPAFDREWAELTAAERRAAKALGYTSRSWDDDLPVSVRAAHGLSASDAHGPRG